MAHVVLNQSGIAALADECLDHGATAALAMGADAQVFAPVRTGALRASIGVDEIGRGVWRIHAGRGLPDGRAVFNELGTSRMRAQPYLRPAVYQGRAL
jgi:hypothetical protein